MEKNENIENNWFIEYCNMSKDEKDLYQEFEIKDTDKINLKLYKRMYDSLTLMSLDYEEQSITFPEDINVPDEIALVFNDEVIEMMDGFYKNGMLSTDDCVLIKKIDNKLLEIGEKQDEDLWTLYALEHSKLWEECRKYARLLLSSLHNIE